MPEVFAGSYQFAMATPPPPLAQNTNGSHTEGGSWYSHGWHAFYRPSGLSFPVVSESAFFFLATSSSSCFLLSVSLRFFSARMCKPSHLLMCVCVCLVLPHVATVLIPSPNQNKTIQHTGRRGSSTFKEASSVVSVITSTFCLFLFFCFLFLFHHGGSHSSLCFFPVLVYSRSLPLCLYIAVRSPILIHKESVWEREREVTRVCVCVCIFLLIKKKNREKK